ncbi:hypothetical protein [Pleurocapsa sp. PCC 7319]|uniref:hypothetical protein n=1 Tax=Pleurocapsa sp. PCC 7319 TaxID=118161 RepID=UPI00035F703B|nr:hypothetical protein [Pleurocapsa sp. PCC 7319]
MSEHQVLADTWLDLLKKSEIFKLSDVFGSPKSYDRLPTASSTHSQIANNISLLSDVEKRELKQYLQERANRIDSNLLSNLSKFGSNKQIPSFVYVVLGTIIGYGLMNVLDLSFSIVLLASFGLISSLMYLILINSQNRHYYNYLLKLLD